MAKAYLVTNPVSVSASSKFPPGFYTIHKPQHCDQLIGNRPIHLVRQNAYEGKEIASRMDKNGIRKYLIPAKQPNIYPGIMTKKEYEELKERGRYVTWKERDAADAAALAEKERLTQESLKRKEAFRKMDAKTRKKDEKVTEVEEEARRRTMHMLEKAYNVRIDQEEEIQKCSRVILETKCRAIRDAQVAEKKLIAKELAEEEKRLNNMMENERRWAIKEDLKKEQEIAAKKHEFAEMLKTQILQNEEQRIVEFEKKQEESRLANLNNYVWEQQAIEKLHNKEMEHAKIRQDLAEGNEQLKHFKVMEEEENRIIDFRIKEYQKETDVRNTKLAAQLQEQKMRKDRERDRIAAEARLAQDLRAHIDELNAARIQEEVEREWRRREKEDAIKKAEALKLLHEERAQQINTKRVMQAMEIERDKREFEKILRVQKAALYREKTVQEEKQQKALVHRTEILKQVNEKERERIQTRQKMFEEGQVIRTTAIVRKKKLQEAMERKCQEMKDNRVPEIYINEVKRRIENIH